MGANSGFQLQLTLLLTQILFPTGDYDLFVHDRSSHPNDSEV